MTKYDKVPLRLIHSSPETGQMKFRSTETVGDWFGEWYDIEVIIEESPLFSQIENLCLRGKSKNPPVTVG